MGTTSRGRLRPARWDQPMWAVRSPKELPVVLLQYGELLKVSKQWSGISRLLLAVSRRD